ncbi:MAG: hypothetical protein AAF667_06230 [Pseudomonadota bacterium]
MRQRNMWDYIGLLGALLGLAVLLYRHRRFFHDDTYISLRYARNLLNHGELSWNLGERIEGYTNFLHVVSAAALMGIGLEPEFAVRFLNALGVVALIFAFWTIAPRVLPGDENAVVRALIVAAVGTTPAVALWVLGGLETVVVAGLLSLGLLALLSEGGRALRLPALAAAALAFSIVVLTRLDAAVLIAGIGFGIFMGAPGGRGRAFLAACIVTGIPALVSFAHMGWRFSYYGELLPLTFYAKAGLSYDIRLLWLPVFFGKAVFWVPIVWFGFLAMISAIIRGPRDNVFWLAAAPLSFGACYVVWSGGDHMPGARFLVPLVPFSALMLLAALRPLSGGSTQMVAAVTAILTLFGAFISPPQHNDNAAFFGRITAERIREAWPDGSLVALHTAGSTPFFADGFHYIDMLGLNDAHIAKRDDIPFPTAAPMQYMPGHAKGDAAYIVERAPDYIIAGPSMGTPVGKPWFLTDVELSENAEFKSCYKMRVETLITPERMRWLSPDADLEHAFFYYERTCD